MYIDADTIIKAASLLGAIGALVAAIVSVYKVIESNKAERVHQRHSGGADAYLLWPAWCVAGACGAGVQRAVQGCAGQTG